jgi:hypothetical protein
VLIVLVSTWAHEARAAKTDVLVLRNGDRITGEIKSLDRGKLSYGTDDAGTLSIEWVKVARLSSPHPFEVEMAWGQRYIGRITAIDSARIAVFGASADTISIPDVVRINSLNAEFLQRVKAFLDVGFTYAKANAARTLTTSGEAAYRGPKFGSQFSFDSYVQGQTGVENTARSSVALSVTRFLPNRWSGILVAQAEQNDELDLARRFTGAGLMSRMFVQSNSTELAAAAGLAVTEERFSASSPGSAGEVRTNLEAMFAASWDAFRFDSPKLDFSTTFNLFPSLSSWGRVRGEFTTRLKYELFPDFDVGLSGTDTFDSDPPEEGATTNDFIVSFTIGWSYRR